MKGEVLESGISGMIIHYKPLPRVCKRIIVIGKKVQ